MDGTAVNSHERIESGNAVSWKCLKCGHVVPPSRNGHGCLERDEIYTAKPNDGTPMDRLDRIEKQLAGLRSSVEELLNCLPAKEEYPDG